MEQTEAVDYRQLWHIMGQGVAATMRGAPGFALRSFPGAWLVTSDLNEPIGNWFACFHDGDDLEGTLHSILANLAERGHPANGWIGQSVLEVAVEMAARFPVTRVRVSPLMLLAGPPVPGGHRQFHGHVRRLTSSDDLKLAYPIMASAFHLDPEVIQGNYRGLLDDPNMSVHIAESDQPASVCISWRSGADCYIYGMATAPDRQRQGTGRAILTAVMSEAVDNGCERFFLTSSEAGEPLYRSMGFEVIEMTERWNICPPTSLPTGNRREGHA